MYVYSESGIQTTDDVPTRIFGYDVAQGSQYGMGLARIDIHAIDTKKGYGRVWYYMCGYKIVLGVVYLLDVPKPLLDQMDVNAAKWFVTIGSTLETITIDVNGVHGEDIQWTANISLDTLTSV